MKRPQTIYVVFSDKPLKVTEDVLAIAGNTDPETNLKELVIAMYQAWLKAFTDDEPLVKLG